MSTITGFTDGPTTSGLMRWYAATLDCGHHHYHPTKKWEPIQGDFQIGQQIECETCKSHTDDLERVNQLDPTKVGYVRISNRFGGQYHVYGPDQTSPTGVMLITTIANTPAITAAIRSMNISIHAARQ